MKNKISGVLFITICSLLLFGCTIKQDVYFNKNFSGNFKQLYDFSEYSKYTKNSKDNSFVLQNSDFDGYLSKVKDELLQIPGISTVKIKNDANNGTVFFEFTFSDINTLNNALKHISDEEYLPLRNSSSFSLENKTLTYTRDKIEELPKDDQGFLGMIKCELTLNFKKKVKQYDIQNNPNVNVSRNKKKFVEKCSLEEIMNNDIKWVFN